MDDCMHGLTVQTCATCSGLDAPPQHTYGSSVHEAKFPGKCRRCGDRIAEGDGIVAVLEDGDAAGWAHAEHREATDG